MEAFQGIKIADFSWTGVGPGTARYFADHGATVVKVENSDHPDVIRVSAPYKDDIAGIDRSSYWANYNCNKLGITLDLNTPGGSAIAERMIHWADIFIESFTPGVIKKFGLDYESIKDLNPALIYASTSQMGQTGPYSRYSGFGMQAAAIAGFAGITGWPDLAPDTPFLSYTDFVAHRYLIISIIVALLHRKKTGRGQYIDQSQAESGLQFLIPPLLDFQINGTSVTRNGNRDPHAAPHGAFRCAGDDRWCVIAVFNDTEWQILCAAMGKPDLAHDPKFCTLSRRKDNEDELEAIIEAWTIHLPAETVMNTLQGAGVAAGIVETAEDMHNDPQLKHRHHFWVYDHPVVGPHTVEAPALQLSKTPAKQYRRAPCMGEHNEYVCTKILGISDEEFVEMLAGGAFG
jgi:benzylsuccinate CoA-transferase BbsF subunit